MNPYADDVIMARMATILARGVGGAPPVPSFITKGGAIYVEQKYAMSQSTMPACLIEASTQAHSRNSQRTHLGALQVIISVYDRWDQQDATLDTIRVGIKNDVKLLMATLQANENLVYGNNAMATSIPRYTISAYKPETDEQFLGMHLVFQALIATVNILPYDE